MEPDTKDRDFMYRLIIGQLYYDGHNELALDLSNSIGMKKSPPPSDNLFRLVSVARQNGDNADEEEKEADMRMSLCPVVSSIDSLSIEEECGDYFPILSLPAHILDNIFSVLDIEDRMALAGGNKILNKIESESKYYVESLAIAEMPFIGAPPHRFIEQYRNEYKHWIVLFENKSYSSDFMRRIAHNASIGELVIQLLGSSEFHREIFHLIKEIDIGKLHLYFKNVELASEIMVESFVFELAKSCKVLCSFVAPETIHQVYKILLDGSTKLREFNSQLTKEKCSSFLNLIGITYRDGTLFSNREIEIYKVDYDEDDDDWHVYDGQLEIIICTSIFEVKEIGSFKIVCYDAKECLEKAKRLVEKMGGRRI